MAKQHVLPAVRPAKLPPGTPPPALRIPCKRNDAGRGAARNATPATPLSPSAHELQAANVPLARLPGWPAESPSALGANGVEPGRAPGHGPWLLRRRRRSRSCRPPPLRYATASPPGPWPTDARSGALYVLHASTKRSQPRLGPPWRRLPPQHFAASRSHAWAAWLAIPDGGAPASAPAPA